jgi:PAS domain S-box-containing protein
MARATPPNIGLLETQLQATLDKIPAYTWYAAPTGALTFLNERCADYLGLTQDHPLRFGIETGAAWDSHLSFVYPDDHDETRRVWANCLRTGSAGEVSFRVRNAEGIYRWFLSRAEPLRANDGTLLHWIGVNVDIEDRKQAEFYLGEGQRLAHTGSWAFNAAGFTHWSSELFAIHGLDPRSKAPSLQEYMALVHPEDREFVARKIETMLADHHAFDFTKRIVRPDGTVRHVRCVGVAATHGEGQEFVGTGIDVTEQEQLTQALRKTQQEFRQILDFTPQLIAVLGPRRERLYANHMALAYLGISLDESRQLSVGSEAHPDDAERMRTDPERSLSTGSAHELEVRLRKSDGSYRWFLARYNPVRDDQGQLIRWYVACTDIDDRKRAEERMRNETVALREDLDRASILHARYDAALEERTRVARELHDTLLQGFSGITLQLQALQHSLPETAYDSTERLTRVLAMADETLRGARQAIWDMRAPELGDHDLADALEAAARSAVSDSPVELSFTVRGDRRRLAPLVESTALRIGREAVINAVRHGKPQVVQVDLVYGDAQLDLQVRDDGLGFNPDNANTAAANGHWGVRGMYERAARAGGALAIEATTGRGTEVRLSLPASCDRKS